jgi:hypothetical protein
MEKDKTLMEESPQKISAGIIQFFMVMNGIQFKKKEFAKMFGFSEVTINNIFKRIVFPRKQIYLILLSNKFLFINNLIYLDKYFFVYCNPCL